jgi:hypothetical protein
MKFGIRFRISGWLNLGEARVWELGSVWKLGVRIQE